MRSTISFVIPVYNVEPYIRICLDSIAKQEYEAWEAILIDDGSTDGSSEICDEYAEKDARFKVFHQENSGVSAARNVGLRNATGQWIWFVDSDDYILPGALSRLDKVINENDCDTIFFGKLEDSCGDICNRDSYRNDIINLCKQEFLRKVSCHFNQTMLFNKKLLDENKINFSLDIKLSEDLELQYKYLFYAQKPIQIADSLYVYRRRDGSAMRSEDSYRSNLFCTFKVCENLLELIREKQIPVEEWFTIRVRQLLKSGLQSAERLSHKELRGIKKRLRGIISEYTEIGYGNISDGTIKLAMINLRLYFYCLRIFYKINGII